MKKKCSLFRKSWYLAFVKGGIDALFTDQELDVEIVKNPFRDRWFADPFVLDVTDKKIYLLAEELCYDAPKGRVAKLTIDRQSMTIEKYDIILECPTHLSFPNILRKDGTIYVYPETCRTGKLDIYEYDQEHERLVSPKKICNDGVWDAAISDLLGKRQLFAACQDDYIMDVYDWDEGQQIFIPSQTIRSEQKDNRMAGQLFEYKGEVYCPTQDCSQTYGGGVWLKRVVKEGEKLQLVPVKKITPPSKTKYEGLHTLNEYKGVVVVDLKGWVHPLGQKLYNLFRTFIPKSKAADI